MSNKKLAALIVAGGAGLIIIAGTGLLAIQGVQALIGSGGYSDLVENLASKFNLDPAAVEQVFEDTEDERRSERLQEAVDDGDITAEQKTMIESKLDEHEAKIQEINDKELTATERIEAMQGLREEMEDWADENDIPSMFIMMGRMGGRGGRDGMMMDGGMGRMGF